MVQLEHRAEGATATTRSTCPARGTIKAFFEAAFGWSFVDYGPEYTAFSDQGLDGGFYKSELKAATDRGSALIVLFSHSLEETQAKVERVIPPPPPGSPGMYALSDDSALRAFAARAGLEPEPIVDVESPVIYPSLEVAIRGILSSGNAAKAMEQVGESTIRYTYVRVLTKFQEADGAIRIGASLRCLFCRP